MVLSRVPQAPRSDWDDSTTSKILLFFVQHQLGKTIISVEHGPFAVKDIYSTSFIDKQLLSNPLMISVRYILLEIGPHAWGFGN